MSTLWRFHLYHFQKVFCASRFMVLIITVCSIHFLSSTERQCIIYSLIDCDLNVLQSFLTVQLLLGALYKPWDCAETVYLYFPVQILTLTFSSLLTSWPDDGKFPEAVRVLLTWLERGEVNRRNANNFYSMIQSSNSHIRRLMGEKSQHEKEMEEAKEKFKTALAGIVGQCEFYIFSLTPPSLGFITQFRLYIRPVISSEWYCDSN